MSHNSDTQEALKIFVRYSTGTYCARAKGRPGTASCTISARQAADAMARKLGLDPTLLQLDFSSALDGYTGVFNHPGAQP